MKVRKNEYKSHISPIPTHRKEVLLQTWAADFACKQGRISAASTGAELSTQCQPLLQARQAHLQGMGIPKGHS